MLVRALGLKDYREAWALQKSLVEERRQGKIPDTLLLLEHPPVYTRGASSKSPAPAFLPHPLHEVERGGDLTYHGPGQLVGYPIIHLGERALKVRTYLRSLEAVLIEALRPLEIEAEALRGFTGVWAGRRKLASIGIAVKDQVAYHGFALNVNCDLAAFSAIHPCNLEPEQMTSLERLWGRPADFGAVLRRVAEGFLEVF
ncbi:MAG: lipoyl(octanoyl) transferase LipB [Elusimicrobia bacterium]|nr:lipoyl(octanoyl) transferase LipB [Elusimicrobiota bacterium]